MNNPIIKAREDYTDYITRYGIDEAARILDSYRETISPRISHMCDDDAAWETSYIEAAAAIIAAHKPAEAAQAAPVPICTIALNEGDGRQTISWNPADGMLYSDAQEAPADGYGYSDAAEALDAASYIWGDPIWELDII